MFMLLISVTVLSRIGPSKGSGTAACGIAWVQGCQAAGANPRTPRTAWSISGDNSAPAIHGDGPARQRVTRSPG